MKNLAVMTLIVFGLQQASAIPAESNSRNDLHTSDISHSENIPGCADLLSVRAILKFVATTEAGETAEADLADVRAAYRAMCSVTTPQKGASIYYPNGRTATHYARTEGASWYYPNGNTMTHYAGQKGASWYYSNGRTITHYMGQAGASWYYPEGQTITHYYGQKGASWYYPNGRTITHYAGQKGASWYYANGTTLSHYFGQAGASWYFEDGSTWTHSGVELSEESLLYPHLLLARLFSDEARR